MEIAYCQQTTKPGNSVAARFTPKGALRKHWARELGKILDGRLSPLKRNMPESHTLFDRKMVEIK
jgi:hypothetical protein